MAAWEEKQWKMREYTSFLRTSQFDWKKAAGNPSGLGAFQGAIFWRAKSISKVESGLANSCFCSSVKVVNKEICH